MKYLFVLFYLVVCCQVAVVAQNGNAVKKQQFNQVLDAQGNIISTQKPLFAFTGGSSFDFGEVKAAEKIYHDFEFTNIGFQPLIISKVKSSCYCITSDWDKTPILPGQKGKIRVWFDTRVRKGSFRNGVTIYSNAYSYPEETLLVSGFIVD
ncbi:MAG: DUF1573 domain-containing protein [Chitinophagales bacterium]|nr:DUF1573 domain-containing protein [Chitinophagales bacterium]